MSKYQEGKRDRYWEGGKDKRNKEKRKERWEGEKKEGKEKRKDGRKGKKIRRKKKLGEELNIYILEELKGIGWNESRDERIDFYRKGREKNIKKVVKMETIKSEEKIDSRGETLVEGRETNEGWRGER